MTKEEKELVAIDSQLLQWQEEKNRLMKLMNQTAPPNFRRYESDYIERMFDVSSQIEALEMRKQSLEKSVSVHSSTIIEKWLNG